jgi:hypothetical protein
LQIGKGKKDKTYANLKKTYFSIAISGEQPQNLSRVARFR